MDALDEFPPARRVGRNAAINVVGALVSIVVALVTVPAYLGLIGEARYGVLAVVWVVLGYFGVFDLGLSRATANQIARMRGESDASRERVFWTALSMNACLGVLGGVALLLAGDFLLGHVVKTTDSLHMESVNALPWLAAAVPLTTVTLVLVGTLEGQERFLTVNVMSTIGLAMFQLAPLAYAYWESSNLSGLIMAATLALTVSTLLLFIVTAKSLPVRGRPRIDGRQLGILLRYGGWISVTGLVGPLLTVADRIVIGGVLGATAVTRYTVPFALVSRVQILSGGLARAVFPRFSALHHTDAAHVSRGSLRALTVIMTVMTVTGAVFLAPFLKVWVGSDIASESAPVGEILLLGMWLNSLAVVPFALLQAQARPDLPAKFHVGEVLPYVGLLWLGLEFAGIRGAAAAWTARAGADAVLLFWAVRRSPSGAAAFNLRHMTVGGAFVGMACAASLTAFGDPRIRIALGGALIVGSVLWAWKSAPSVRRIVHVVASHRWRQLR